MRSTAAHYALPLVVAIVALLAFVAVAPPPVDAQTQENDTTTFEFDLRTNNDARVTVTVRMPLAGSADVEAFERVAAQHTGGGDSPLSVTPFREAAARASESAGRPMEITEVSRSASQTNVTGRLGLSFTWTNFTRTEGGRIVVGDAFQTPGGTWLPGLSADQELILAYPSGYSPQRILIPGTIENNTIRVRGPTTFQPGSPSVVLERSGQPQPNVVLAAGILVGLLILAIVAYLFRERLAELDPRDGEEAPGPAQPDPTEPVVDVDPELLSDEERVLRLLETQGGRMKQVDIVQETDWSNAKVSQLLSEMEDADRVEKLRIGRENLISLPGEGPAAGNDDPRDVD